MAIPKIIHYCWFGGKPKPPLARKCIASWQKFCPEYEIREWNEENFQMETAPEYVHQAYSLGRWAFVADYVRLKALTELGGIYLDTDVELIASLNPFLHHRAFAGLEGLGRVQTGLMACQPGFPLFLEFLHHYENAKFLTEDGRQDVTTNVAVFSRLCRAHGLQPRDCYQEVAGLSIYPKTYFCPVDFDTMKLHKSRKTVCIHWFSASWHTQEEENQLKLERAQREAERRSIRRHRIGTLLLGEIGYQKCKALFRRR